MYFDTNKIKKMKYSLYLFVVIFVLTSCTTQKEKSEAKELMKPEIIQPIIKSDLNQVVGSYQIFIMEGLGEVSQNNPYLTIEESGKIFGNNGCNTFFGRLLPNSQEVVFDKLGSTRMACQDDKASMEKVFMELMSRVTSIRKIMGNQIEFLVDETIVLKGVKISLNTGYFNVKSIKGKPLKLENVFFSVNEGIIEGNTGCNSFYGSIIENGLTIKLGDISSTEMVCEEINPTFESDFLNALQASSNYIIEDNIYIFYEGNQETLSATKD
jgi:heat shock protein HslJ